MARVIIRLNDQEIDALSLLAEQERRDPRVQAALLVCRELERLGLLRGKGNAPIGILKDGSTGRASTV